MIRRALRSPFTLVALLLAAAALGPTRAVAQPAEELPAEGQNALKDEYEKWNTVWKNLKSGQEVADPANTQHGQATDAVARYSVYRLTWGLEKEPGKFSEVLRELNENLESIRFGGEKTQTLAEMFTKALIAHLTEVLQTRKPIARINAAMMLARLTDRQGDEKPDDVLHRMAGTNQAALAGALAGIIKDPNQLDAARFWAFRGLQRLLTLPRSEPPALPRDKEEAALGEVLTFLQTPPKQLPPGAPDEEVDGVRYLRREAVKALAAGRYPTLSTLPDKPHPTWRLLQIAARDGIDPEPRMDERVEAAIGVAHAQAGLDKDYQPDYAAHQLGLFVVDFIRRYEEEKQAQGADPTKLPTAPWKIEASRLIEALEFMKAQTKNAYVTTIVDASIPLLTPLEKALPTPNVADLENKLRAEAAPSKELYQGAPQTTVTFGGKPAAPAPKPEDKKDK